MHLAPRRLTQGSSGPYNTPVGEVTHDGGLRVAVLVCGNGTSYYKPVLGLLDEIVLFQENQTVPAILAMHYTVFMGVLGWWCWPLCVSWR
jgi:hypothetical protein